MIVASDTSPFNYLLLLEAVEVLPQLYGSVIVPEAVQQEMPHQEAQAWKLKTIGTLGILVSAAGAGLLDLADAVARLQQTDFYVSEKLIKTLFASQASE